MNAETFKNISRIIERDSKTTTYKFALLRGTIDIIQDGSPFIKLVDDRVHMPLGLMIEKWMVYYYPLLESNISIPQINSSSNLAFEPPLRGLIAFYENQNSLSVFYNDLKRGTIPSEILPVFRQLVKSLKSTIVRMPMKYIGNSVYGMHNAVYRKESNGEPGYESWFDRNSVIEKSGWFSIPVDYFEALRLIGNFVGGQDSILFKWAEFSKGANRSLAIETALGRILESPITERDSLESRRLYREMLSRKGSVKCVWSGHNINDYHVDHIIPFSIWKNNDLWNLLPSSGSINSQKSNKIPTPEMLRKCEGRILEYWKAIEVAQPKRFMQELKVSLLGDYPAINWQYHALSQLQSRSAYLIENRGFEPWSI
jgi:hypothetical protein